MSTAELLVSGGDSRIMLDPASGASRYGSRPAPDAALVPLGSCTASLISPAGWAAAAALHHELRAALDSTSEPALYADRVQRLRHALLSLLGCADDGVQAIFAASGSDLFALAGQWLQPDDTVIIDAAETGSGVPFALQGKHFDTRTASGAAAAPGEAVSGWHGRLHALAARAPDGHPLPADEIDARCTEIVDAVAGAGKRVLLVLTDVSKTGMIVPGIDRALALQRRWPGQVDVLVDACQFRLTPQTIRAYLAHGCLVALTGSKFIGGPTFCGTLLVPGAQAQRWRERALPAACANYSNAAEWPAGWAAAAHLPKASNFGLLLRWQAALAELRLLLQLPPDEIRHKLATFADAVRSRLAVDERFVALPVPALERAALHADGWDSEQTIFPFLVRGRDGFLTREQTAQLYRQLRDGTGDASAPRYALGQPVACGMRDGVAVAALRICLGAPLLASTDTDTLVGHAMAAFDAAALLALKV